MVPSVYRRFDNWVPGETLVVCRLLLHHFSVQVADWPDRDCNLSLRPGFSPVTEKYRVHVLQALARAQGSQSRPDA